MTEPLSTVDLGQCEAKLIWNLDDELGILRISSLRCGRPATRVLIVPNADRKKHDKIRVLLCDHHADDLGAPKAPAP